MTTAVRLHRRRRHLGDASVALVACPIMDADEGGRLFPALQDADRESPQLGVYLLLAQLRANGVPAVILDLVADPLGPFHPETISRLSSFDLILFSCNSMNWAIVRRLAHQVRLQQPKVKIVVGGPHATHYPESVVSARLFDGYFRGEADRWIVSVVEAALSGEATPNIPGYGTQSSPIPIVVNETHLDDLVVEPAYDELPAGVFKALPIQTSRGCKFSCAFCSIPRKGNWRGFGHHFAKKQIEFADRHSTKVQSGLISIVDDTFTTDHERILSLCGELDTVRYAHRLVYDATIADLQNARLVECLAPFSSDLLVGAEVSTKDDAKRIHKAASPLLIRRAAENLSRSGIADRAVFSFIIGFPWHTKRDCLETLSFVKSLILEYGVRTYIQWYWPMPGSEIWNQLQQRGAVSIEMLDEPGFYRTHEWFFPVRELSESDVDEIDEKVKFVRSMLSLVTNAKRTLPIEYSPPLHNRKHGEHVRTPALAAP
jgi:anaerobic magnesium-protoporphyrin IX monomethyl ester cyclase